MIAARLRQVSNLLRPAPLSEGDLKTLDDLLTEPQRAAFLRLPKHDQAHLICVLNQVMEDGWDDRDLLIAALLHDVGKVSGTRSPSLFDRSVLVLLQRVSPRLTQDLTSSPTWWNRGLFLAVHHPRLGAELATLLGCTDRTVDLIARHAQPDTGDDPLLAELQRADSAC